MKQYRVVVEEMSHATYYVFASSAEEADQFYYEGEHMGTDEISAVPVEVTPVDES